jgi:hypothetical protein
MLNIRYDSMMTLELTGIEDKKTNVGVIRLVTFAGHPQQFSGVSLFINGYVPEVNNLLEGAGCKNIGDKIDIEFYNHKGFIEGITGKIKG